MSKREIDTQRFYIQAEEPYFGPRRYEVRNFIRHDDLIGFTLLRGTFDNIQDAEIFLERLTAP